MDERSWVCDDDDIVFGWSSLRYRRMFDIVEEREIADRDLVEREKKCVCVCVC